MKNLFTAPDITDLLRERSMSLRNVAILGCTGFLLVVALLGGYRLGTWFLVHTAPADVAPLSTEEASAEVSVLEARLQELGEGGGEGNPAVVETRVREMESATEEPAPIDQQLFEDRLKELGG
jgi:hypothetical protein